MHLRRRLAGALLALAVTIPLSPMAPPTGVAAAGECGSYASETVPPPTIRVFRTATGAVDTVDFRTYVKNVLSREWISSWTTESLRSGALAVKNYAWYQVIHWRGYVNTAGQCFDVFDSTRDQHYDPSRPTYASMAAAVDATWGTLAQKAGRIFATYYNAGQAYEACGANANGWQMFQWGTQGCGLIGKTAAEIMAIYYPGVIVTAAPPAATPAPTPAPLPTPRADGDADPLAVFDRRARRIAARCADARADTDADPGTRADPGTGPEPAAGDAWRRTGRPGGAASAATARSGARRGHRGWHHRSQDGHHGRARHGHAVAEPPRRRVRAPGRRSARPFIDRRDPARRIDPLARRAGRDQPDRDLAGERVVSPPAARLRAAGRR
jgi:hypothetical protein